MEDNQIRIACLKAQIKNIDETIYPDGYEEAKIVMTCALRDRVRMIEESTRKRV